VNDACGNFITVSQNLIRTIDTTLPTASNPNSITISGCNGTFPNPAVSAVADASDNCSIPIVTFVNDSVPTVSGCTETTVRTYKVTDACGNFINVTQNIIRTIDTNLPTASNPNPIAILGCNGTFSEPNNAVVTDASDNCSTPNVTFVNDSLPTISGCIETTVRTYKVTDACGNFINVTQNLIRTIDTTLPTASNPNPIAILGCNGTFSEPNIAVITDASDNCSTPNITFVNDGVPTVSGCTETTVRTYKVTDACGNFITVSQNLIRTIDTTLPTASNPNPIAISGCNGTFPSPAVSVVADASDNCSTPIVTFVNDSLPTVSGCTETTIRTYKVTDACGNFITVSQNLIRTIDTTLPTASNPNPIAISGCNGTFSAPNNAVVTDALDNCSAPIVTFVNDSLPTVSGCIETTVRTYKVTDACGNFINVTQNLIRTIDTALPTASNPNPITILGCNGTFSEPNNAVVTDASDNCSTPNITFVNDSVPTISGCIETTVRTYKVTDACGNFINVTQNLIRTIDTTLPTASNPNSIMISGCNGTFPSPAVSVVADASDNCSTPIVSFVNDSSPIVSGCTETTIRTYKVTDACGNFITVSQNLIRTIDAIAPTFTSTIPTNITVSCDAIPIIPLITATDNCGNANITLQETKINGSCISSYILKRTWTASDFCGNSKTASQEISVSDTQAPTILGPFDTVLNVNCDRIPDIPILQFIDNCSGVGTIITPTADVQINQTPSSYSIIREWNVSDLCGNSHIFTQTINVTIQDSYTVLQEQACNGDASVINLNDIIPRNTLGLGTWTDLSTGMAITNGIFTPLGVLLGEHSFEYKISDLYCPRKIEISMNVNDDCLVLACGNIIVHNAFSPNNDGLNEIFTIENLENKTCYPTNKVSIYNRWGILIYETEEYDNTFNAFKGISEGRTTIKKSDELPSGTYYYILDYTDDQGKKHNKDGYLYLSR
jgi:gliding motility-associated-like protein